MKKYFYIILAAALAAVSCAKEAQVPGEKSSPKEGYVIHASISDFTKAEINESDGKITWNEGDEFIVQGDDSNWYTFVASASGASVDFVCADAPSSVSFTNQKARYPKSKFSTSSNSFSLPTSYSSPKAALKEGNFMTGTISSEGSVTFSHDLVGMLKVTFNNVPTSADNVYFDNGLRSATVSLAGASGDNVVVYCPIYWQGGSLTVSLRDASNNVIIQRSTTVQSGVQGKLYALKPLDVVTYTVAGSSQSDDNDGSVFVNPWDINYAGNEMESQPDGTYKKEYTVSAACDLKFKVVKNHSYSEGQWPLADYPISIVEAGTLIITFNPSTSSVFATVEYDSEYRLYVLDEKVATTSTWGTARNLFANAEVAKLGTETYGSYTYNSFALPSTLVGQTVDIYYKGENNCEVKISSVNISAATKNYYFRTDGVIYVAVTDPASPEAVDTTPRIYVNSNDVNYCHMYNNTGSPTTSWPGIHQQTIDSKYNDAKWQYADIHNTADDTFIINNNNDWQNSSITFTDSSVSHYYTWIGSTLTEITF